MPDILKTSLTGLLAFQAGLATTNNNVANVNTEGYSRQRVNFSTLPGQNVGVGYIGRGVEVDSITRVLDQFRVDQLRGSVSEQQRLQSLNELSAGLDSLLASPDSGLSEPLQALYAGVQNLADNPASITARQVTLSEATTLADRFGTLSSRFDARSVEVNTRLDAAVTEVNALAASVADLNLAIRDATAAGGAPPNDLLDQRDLVLRQLAEQIAMDVVAQEDGSVSVFVGNGQALVLGQDASALALLPGEYATSNPEIALVTATGSTLAMNDLRGGNIGGLLDYRREVLDPSRNALGQIATGLAQSFNAQHRQGMDLQGNLGGDFFAIAAPEVLAGTSNTGGGDFTVSVSDVGGLTSSDYILAFNSGSYSLTRADTGAAVALAGSGTGADPFTADGLSIVVNSAPAAGDTFLVRPTARAAESFAVALADPQEIAAALPIISGAALTNSGTGRIAGDEVLDVTDPALLDPVTVTFIDATSYAINGAGSFAYTAGDPIEVNGWRVRIDGAPQANDEFTVSSNAGGVGDNRNALALSDTLNGGVLAGGSTSVRQGYENLVSEVSTETRRSGINLAAQSAITERALQDQLSVSGVNLDEEAANMLRFQQAYQAMAQMIGVADAMFQTILAATGR